VGGGGGGGGGGAGGGGDGFDGGGDGFDGGGDGFDGGGDGFDGGGEEPSQKKNVFGIPLPKHSSLLLIAAHTGFGLTPLSKHKFLSPQVLDIFLHSLRVIIRSLFVTPSTMNTLFTRR